MLSGKHGHWAAILVLTNCVDLPSPGVLEKLEGKTMEKGNKMS